jgi:aminoglycoside phosphotransferase
MLKAFAKKVKRIRELDVRGCPITSSAVNALAKNCL